MRLSTIAYAAHFSLGLRAFILAVIVAGTFPVMALAQQVCVSDGSITPSTPDTIYEDNHDGTVTDASTGLMWMQCSLGQSGEDCSQSTATTHNWQEALAQAINTNYAGHSDWRLPNIRELLSLVEVSCYLPSINITFFPNRLGSRPYWSSSILASDANKAWSVNFGSGNASSNYRDDNRYVRLVRGGK